VLAIGGVTVERFSLVAGTGAAGVAAIGLFTDAASSGAEGLHALVSQASALFDTHESVP
jgi:thiamine monophosphate synthase